MEQFSEVLVNFKLVPFIERLGFMFFVTEIFVSLMKWTIEWSLEIFVSLNRSTLRLSVFIVLFDIFKFSLNEIFEFLVIERLTLIVSYFFQRIQDGSLVTGTNDFINSLSSNCSIYSF